MKSIQKLLDMKRSSKVTNPGYRTGYIPRLQDADLYYSNGYLLTNDGYFLSTHHAGSFDIVCFPNKIKHMYLQVEEEVYDNKDLDLKLTKLKMPSNRKRKWNSDYFAYGNPRPILEEYEPNEEHTISHSYLDANKNMRSFVSEGKVAYDSFAHAMTARTFQHPAHQERQVNVEEDAYFIVYSGISTGKTQPGWSGAPLIDKFSGCLAGIIIAGMSDNTESVYTGPEGIRLFLNRAIDAHSRFS